jgi:hypothetical protein
MEAGVRLMAKGSDMTDNQGGGFGSTHAPKDQETANKRAWKAAEGRYGKVVHQTPPDGSGTMPCCGSTPFEVPRWHRMATDPTLVTCGKHVPESKMTTARSVWQSSR